MADSNSIQQPESSLRLAIQEYDAAWMELFTSVVVSIQAEEPFIGLIQPVRTEHLGPLRNVRDPHPLDQPMAKGGFTISIPVEATRNTDVDEHSKMLIEAGRSNLDMIGPSLFSSIREVISATGNTVNCNGEVTLEAFRELLRKMDIGFNEDGSIQPLTLVVPPGLESSAAALKEAVSKDPACNQIILSKRAQFLASKRTRRLSRQSL